MKKDFTLAFPHLEVGEFTDMPASSAVPKWLEDYDGELTFLTDVIILRRQDGYEVRAKNPDYTDAFMHANECTFVNGKSGVVNFVGPLALDRLNARLRAENERRKAVERIIYRDHVGVAQMVMERLEAAEAKFSSEEIEEILAALASSTFLSREVAE